MKFQRAGYDNTTRQAEQESKKLPKTNKETKGMLK